MPEKGRLVIVNATPIIALALVDRLDLLAGLYGEMTIPEAVRSTPPLRSSLVRVKL
jgi:predicted nucleic acid-binding protein